MLKAEHQLIVHINQKSLCGFLNTELYKKIFAY